MKTEYYRDDYLKKATITLENPDNTGVTIDIYHERYSRAPHPWKPNAMISWPSVGSRDIDNTDEFILALQKAQQIAFGFQQEVGK